MIRKCKHSQFFRLAFSPREGKLHGNSTQGRGASHTSAEENLDLFAANATRESLIPCTFDVHGSRRTPSNEDETKHVSCVLVNTANRSGEKARIFLNILSL